jgi:hypothetical protein
MPVPPVVWTPELAGNRPAGAPNLLAVAGPPRQSHANCTGGAGTWMPGVCSASGSRSLCSIKPEEILSPPSIRHLAPQVRLEVNALTAVPEMMTSGNRFGDHR